MGCFDCEKLLQEHFLLNVFHYFFFFFPTAVRNTNQGSIFQAPRMFFPPRCKSFCGRCGSRAASEVPTFIPASYQRHQIKKESTSTRIKACCRPAAQHENTTSWSSVGGPAVIVSCQTSKVLPHSFAPDILLPFIYFFFPIRWYFGGGATRDQI